MLCQTDQWDLWHLLAADGLSLDKLGPRGGEITLSALRIEAVGADINHN